MWPNGHQPADQALHPAKPAAGAVVALVAFWLIGIVYVDGWTLDLGTIGFPRPRTLIFYATWAVCGGTATWFAAKAFASVLTRGASSAWFAAAQRSWLNGSERLFMAVTTLLTLAIAVAIRAVVLGGAPLTDDESAYRFMAELISTGRLWVESPPDKLFFDRAFMVNDGKLYAGYFVGWPVLAAPFAWLGLTGWANAVYAAAAVPPLFWLLRDVVGSGWARAGILLAAIAPMPAIAAATELSHTTCLTALTWALWSGHRALGTAARPVHDFAFGLAFSLAFAIRPLSALGIGLPFLLAWLFRLRRHDRRRQLVALLAFGLPSAVMAGLFLAVQWAQTGSPWMPAYNRLLEYTRENRYRFAAFGPETTAHVGNFRFDGLPRAFANTLTGLLRLSFDLFGWWCSFALAWFAGGARGTRLWWASIGSFVLLHLFVSDPGIDSFGPVHYFELALPLLVLSMLGARHLDERGQAALSAPATALTESAVTPTAAVRHVGIATLLALVTTALFGFVPVRLRALDRIAELIRLPQATVAAAGIERAVIFAPRPWAPTPCWSDPTEHFVFFRPNNDPDLANPVLWVNHIDVALDRELGARHFPDRPGYALVWLGRGPRAPPGSPLCFPALLPIDDPKVDRLPPAPTGEPTG